MVVCDLNSDGHLDFLGVGNSFSEETLSGYYDAGVGVCALGKGDGTFVVLPPAKSGLSVRSDAKALAEIKIGNKRKWILTSNESPLRMFGDSEKNIQENFATTIRIAKKSAAQKQRVEQYLGSGYLSQSRVSVPIINDTLKITANK